MSYRLYDRNKDERVRRDIRVFVRDCMNAVNAESRSGKGTEFHALLADDERYSEMRRHYDVILTTESPMIFITHVEDFMKKATSIERELRTEGLLDQLVELQRRCEAYSVWVNLRKWR